MTLLHTRATISSLSNELLILIFEAIPENSEDHRESIFPVMMVCRLWKVSDFTRIFVYDSEYFLACSHLRTRS
jgi:hypothetical protein